MRENGDKLISPVLSLTMSPYVRSPRELQKEGGIQQKRLPSVRKGPYRGDVSALCLVSSPQRHLLLAGTGAQVLLYDLTTGDLLSSCNVFDGVRVHGIYSGPAFGNRESSPASQAAFRMYTIVVHGERRVKLFKMLWRCEEETPQLHSSVSLPRFSYWVMDVRILQEDLKTAPSALAADVKDLHLLAVGLSNNTICVWDLLNSAFTYRVECSERCLLYSMRLWGDSLETLHAGAGTVFNEVLVWKLGSNLSAIKTVSTELGSIKNSRDHDRGKNIAQDMTDSTSPEWVVVEEVVHPLQRLLGHEGSIHRLTWSSDGLSLVSVSDDRSARVWCAKRLALEDDPWLKGVVAGPVLYGHGSRLWDCYVDEKLLITASEDCTCRVWTAEGKFLATLKGHTGRGIWRCVYDSEVNSLVTAGADSSIKVQLLDKWVPRATKWETDEDIDPSIQNPELQLFIISPPWLNCASEMPSGFMDSKSEYVRCLALGSPWSLYVCTNQGAVYHVHLQRSKEAFWTLLIDDLDGPIVCMDVLVEGVVRDASSGWDDFPDVNTVIVGNGQGHVSLMRILRTAGHWHCERRYSWAAEKERQLLGVFFCKSLGGRHVFTTDPRGTWHMWHVSGRQFLDNGSVENRSSVSFCTDRTDCNNEEREDFEEYTTDLIAYGRGPHARVLCIDVCPDLQLLVCGDKRGDLAVFSLPKNLSQQNVDGMNTEKETLTESPVVAVFKGAHGISAVASVSVLRSKHGQHAEIISTGGDGCICRFLLEWSLAAAMPQPSTRLLCTGIEKVAALSIVECLEYCRGAVSQKRVERRIATGFAGSEFVLWDLTHQCEVMRVICGGWRRPHSVLVGDFPELQYCLGFIRDQVIQVQRNWATAISPRCGSKCENSSLSGSSFSKTAPKMTMQSLRGQFHGKEISSVLFLDSGNDSLAHEGSSPMSWIATGSEDGTVFISRYTEDVGEQLDPTGVLGDHVGGSAVRALALVTEGRVIRAGELQSPSTDSTQGRAALVGHGSGRITDKQLLFSAGAKEVLTCWLLDWLSEVEGDESALDLCGRVAKLSTSFGEDTPLPRHRAPSSQWLSTHIPERFHLSVAKMSPEEKEKETISVIDIDNQGTLGVEEESSEERKKQDSLSMKPDDADDDQRYLALTAFGVRCMKTGTSISFIATASSNATLHLYAFHVTHRSWIELAVLEYDTALVLAIEHFVAPFSNYWLGGRDLYVVITGATNGNIALWDVTNLVHQNCDFDGLDINRASLAPLRPLTGRGSQGGRHWTKTAEQPSASLSSKRREGKSSAGREKAVNLDPLRPAFVSGVEIDIPNEENANGISNSSIIQASTEPAEIKQSLRLSPLHEVTAAHQSGINCMTVARVQRAEECASSKMVYLVISGGDDQALHVATFTLEMSHSNDFERAQRPEFESIPAHVILPVLRCLSKSSVPCAHTSSVKGVWTDGLWAFSTGLDQRLRCWRIDVDTACSELQPDSCEIDDSHPNYGYALVECVTCVIDVPEPASLHAKPCLGFTDSQNLGIKNASLLWALDFFTEFQHVRLESSRSKLSIETEDFILEYQFMLKELCLNSFDKDEVHYSIIVHRRTDVEVAFSRSDGHQ